MSDGLDICILYFVPRYPHHIFTRTVSVVQPKTFSRRQVLAGSLGLASLAVPIIAACAQAPAAPTPQVIEKVVTQVVQQPVPVTQVVTQVVEKQSTVVVTQVV